MRSRLTETLCGVGALLAVSACTASRPLPHARQRPDSHRPESGQRAPAFDLLASPGVTAAERDRLTRCVARGVKKVESFFGGQFSARFTVYLLASRADLDRFWRRQWDEPTFRSQCWMVASGRGDAVVLLSPQAWRKEACEHDPDREVHVENLVTHELVHAYHDQHNPAHGFEGLEAIEWFAEGIATYVSEQMDEGRQASPTEAVRLNLGPRTLDQAWTGKYRYGVCGSLVKFLASRGGKPLLIRLLRATSPAEIYRETGLEEEQLLQAWRDWVRQR